MEGETTVKRTERPALAVVGAFLALAGLLSACAAAPAPESAPGAGPGPAPNAAPETAPIPAPAPAPPVANRELLLATLWVQSAAEYEAGALQAYAAASDALERAVADPSWTAALEQEDAGASSLPPAVILDVDETVLDNSAFEARYLLDGGTFDLDDWHRWCEERIAAPVPGALEFTRHAASLGVRVFYVTNRRAVVLEATRDNLARHGFPLAADRETVLARGGRPGWDSSDKGPRRAAVAREFRVLLQVGDNLGDFLSGIETTPAERADLVERHRSWWGSRWIVLPNPMYGSWLDAAAGFERLPPEEVLRRLYDALEP